MLEMFALSFLSERFVLTHFFAARCFFRKGKNRFFVLCLKPAK